MSYKRVNKTKTPTKKKATTQQTIAKKPYNETWLDVLPQILEMNKDIVKTTKPKIYYPFGKDDPYNVAKGYQGNTYHTTKQVEGWIPLKYLFSVPHGNLLRRDTKAIEESMKKHGFLGGSGQKIIIDVYYDGKVKIVEGNHRVVSAKRVLPLDELINVKICYKGNAESVKDIWRIKDDWF